jgi:hypothetical protein
MVYPLEDASELFFGRSADGEQWVSYCARKTWVPLCMVEHL